MSRSTCSSSAWSRASRSRARRAQAHGRGRLVVGPAASLLAACGGVEGTKKRRAPTSADGREPSEDGPSAPSRSRTGRSTSTQKADRAGRRRPAATMKYIEDYNDNEEFFAKVRQELEADRPIGRELVAPTDWMAGALDRPRLRRADRQGERPERQEPPGSLARPPYDPERNFTLPWQSGITAIGYNPKKTGREAHERQRPLRPGVQGPRDDVQRVARLARASCCSAMGKDPTKAPRTTTSRRSRRSTRRAARARSAASPATTTPRTWRREPLGLRRLVRRSRAAQGRQPGPRVPRPRGGRHDLVGQHADARSTRRSTTAPRRS